MQDDNKRITLLMLRFLREHNLLIAFKMNVMYLNAKYKRYDAFRFEQWKESRGDVVKYMRMRKAHFDGICISPLREAFEHSWANEGFEFWLNAVVKCEHYFEMIGENCHI